MVQSSVSKWNGNSPIPYQIFLSFIHILVLGKLKVYARLLHQKVWNLWRHRNKIFLITVSSPRIERHWQCVTIFLSLKCLKEIKLIILELLIWAHKKCSYFHTSYSKSSRVILLLCWLWNCFNWTSITLLRVTFWNKPFLLKGSRFNRQLLNIISFSILSINSTMKHV